MTDTLTGDQQQLACYHKALVAAYRLLHERHGWRTYNSGDPTTREHYEFEYWGTEHSEDGQPLFERVTGWTTKHPNYDEMGQ